MIKRWCIQFGLWLARLGGWPQVQTAMLPPIPTDVQDAAKRLVADAHRRGPDRSGESKRAQVYWQLINAYPDVSKRVLSVAIEEAVCSDF